MKIVWCVVSSADIVGLPERKERLRSAKDTAERAKIKAKIKAGGWANHADLCRLSQDFGKHAIGPRTILVVRTTRGRGYCEWRWTKAGLTRCVGLGSWASGAPDAEARPAEIKTKVMKLESQQRAGSTPAILRQTAKARMPTFRDAATAYIKAKGSGWRSEVHRQQWTTSLETHVFPRIGQVPVNEVDMDAVLSAIRPIWATKNPTARRVRNRVEQTLDFARVRGWRDGENPARWKGHLAMELSAVNQKVVHLKAVPWQAVPDTWRHLADMDSTAAAALRLVILCVPRSAELCGARWPEFDLENAVWVIPASRTKNGQEDHRVALSRGALELLRALPRYGGTDLLFPGANLKSPISGMALRNALRRAGSEATVHGMRASFATWAADHEKPRDAVEAALDHEVGNRVERSYSRSDRLEPRRALMEAWGDFVTGKTHEQ